MVSQVEDNDQLQHRGCSGSQPEYHHEGTHLHESLCQIIGMAIITPNHQHCTCGESLGLLNLQNFIN